MGRLVDAFRTSGSCPDQHGYFPDSGHFGVAAYCYKGAGQTWQNNIWDDDLSTVVDPCNRGGEP